MRHVLIALLDCHQVQRAHAGQALQAEITVLPQGVRRVPTSGVQRGSGPHSLASFGIYNCGPPLFLDLVDLPKSFDDAAL